MSKLVRAVLGVLATVAVVAGTVAVTADPSSGPLAPARLLARHGEPGRAHAWLARSGLETGVDQMRLEARLLAELGRWAEADSVQARLVPVGDAPALFVHHLIRAELNARSGRPEAALDQLRAMPGGAEAGLEAYRDYIAMDASAAVGDTATALAAGARGLERGVPEALRTAFDERLIALLAADGQAERAIARARAARATPLDLDEQLRLLRAEFDVCLAAGRHREAAAVAYAMVRRYPRGRYAEAVLRDLQRVVAVRSLTKQQALAFAQVLVDRGDTGAAAPLLRDLHQRRLTAHEREALRLCDAEFQYRSGRYERALQLAQPSFADPGFRRESILIAARAQRRLDRPRQAARLYEYFARAFPNDVKASEALYVALGLYEGAADRAGRVRATSTLRKAYPSTYFGRSVEIDAALSAADAGEFSDAVTILARRLQRSRRTDEGALYHLATTYRRSGDVETSEALMTELRRLDPASFYLRPFVSKTYTRPAIRGAGEVEIDGPEGLAVLLQRSVALKEAAVQRIVAAVAPDAADPDCAACLARARAFLDAGLREWGEAELDVARAHGPSSPGTTLELAGVYDAYAMPWRSVRLYQRAKDATPWKLRREHADDFKRLLYPIPHPVQVLENAARYDLPPHLVYAMIREESRFDALAVSRVGAMGLMQLMPETGRYVARELELPEWAEQDLLDPEINLAFGVWYAASLLDAGHGEPVWMLAAYNAGPGNARRWFARLEDGTPVVRAVEGIDFRETREYVQRIVESAHVYRTLYFSGAGGGGAR